jgi:hypothetical protein
MALEDGKSVLFLAHSDLLAAAIGSHNTIEQRWFEWPFLFTIVP